MIIPLKVENTEQAIQEAITFKEQMWKLFTDSAMWQSVFFSGIRIVFIFIMTRLAIVIVDRIIDRSMQRQEKSRLNMNPRRFVTVGELLKNVTSFVCNFFMIMLILTEFGVKIGPLMAGAGVIGLAVGFGAQSLVKDVITGFFIILEDQFAVGDVIQTGSYKGTVEMIGLRTTRIVSWTGEVHIIPNGLITSVTNYSLSNALAVVDIPWKTESNLEEAISIIKQAVSGLTERNEYVLSMPDVLGVQSLSTSEFVIRVAAECMPNTKEKVERQIQLEVRKALEQTEEIRQALQ
ncbi:mechanosensitive ion channel family protein [Paenibacillus sediminis]|uniref:Small conductance mechanosensitive channel n=1 Tax=Paenibacillus sediminis TaxID=664909 RepID=A0ABS4H703_9BACL|nr:mechanosensitive ion channel family protein [Paenibacillus sediminis]MBP1938256.1 small conductance mechanosensitive channel [Paenibacillus sediminis]